MDGEPRGEKQFHPDAELGRSFLVGCGVLIVVFIVGSAIIAYFWLH